MASWEQQLFDELNRVRANPSAYAGELAALRSNYDGTFIHRSIDFD